MNKKLIRLTEQDLHRIVKESVNRVLNEINDYSTYTNENDPHIGQIIKLPSSSVQGIDGEGQVAFEILNIIDNGDFGYRVIVKATKEFGGRPCYGRASGKTVDIALKRAIRFGVGAIESSIEALQYKH